MQVSAYARGCGLNDLPDTYYISSFPDHTANIGVGDCLLMLVLDRTNDTVLSRYLVTLKAIRLRGEDVTEFRGDCCQLSLNLCYIQAPTSRARVSKFAFWDFLRGHITLTDPIPPWRNVAVNAVRLPSSAPADGEGRSSGADVQIGDELHIED